MQTSNSRGWVFQKGPNLRSHHSLCNRHSQIHQWTSEISKRPQDLPPQHSRQAHRANSLQQYSLWDLGLQQAIQYRPVHLQLLQHFQQDLTAKCLFSSVRQYWHQEVIQGMLPCNFDSESLQPCLYSSCDLLWWCGSVCLVALLCGGPSLSFRRLMGKSATDPWKWNSTNWGSCAFQSCGDRICVSLAGTPLTCQLNFMISQQMTIRR